MGMGGISGSRWVPTSISGKAKTMTHLFHANRAQIGNLICFLILVCIGASGQEQRQVDIQKSKLTVRVYKSGLFSAFAHDHEITAPIAHGVFQETNALVELAVEARKLRVVDSEVSDKDRAEIQETMLSAKVLDTEKFPEIRFRSTKVDRLGSDKWAIQGDLSLHGQTRPVKVEVERAGGVYRGAATVSQKDFGIEAIRIAGGAVKVKNEVRIEFEIVGR
jgi:polyisoprenoid-binding protein YceI